jgi:hypothetical protein
VKLLILLLLAGVLDSSYLLYTHYILYNSPFCPIDACIPPDLPVPSYLFAFIGLLWFLAGFLASSVNSKKVLRTWQILGLAGAAGLFSYSITIGYYCPYCYIAQFLGVMSVIASEKKW